jgi:hypothetical protein
LVQDEEDQQDEEDEEYAQDWESDSNSIPAQDILESYDETERKN